MLGAATSCAAEGEQDEAHGRFESAALDAGTLDSTVLDLQDASTFRDAKTLPEPSAAWFASVVHSGTGCPSGTLDAWLARDGRTFSLLFSALEAQVLREMMVADKNCQMEVKLQSPTKLSYAVDDVFFGGYAFLQPGVVARPSMTYGFRGTVAASHPRISRSFVGPFDDYFELTEDTRPPDQLAWSPCGTEAQLSIGLSLRLQNGNPPAAGYLNSACLADGCSARFGLRWQACDE